MAAEYSILFYLAFSLSLYLGHVILSEGLTIKRLGDTQTGSAHDTTTRQYACIMPRTSQAGAEPQTKMRLVTQ